MSTLRLRCRCGAEIEGSAMRVTTLRMDGSERTETHDWSPAFEAWKKEHAGCLLVGFVLQDDSDSAYLRRRGWKSELRWQDPRGGISHSKNYAIEIQSVRDMGNIP